MNWTPWLFWASLARIFESMYYQHRAGHLPDGVWRGWSTEIVTTFGTAGGVDSITGLGTEWMSEDFAQFLTREVRAADRMTLRKMTARWDEAMGRRLAADPSSSPPAERT